MSVNCITFVSMAFFKNSFDITNLYYLLPIVVIKGFKFKPKHQIPFFGIDDCIVSIVPNSNMKSSNRGVRTTCENNITDDIKSLDNSIGIDFQCMKKNLHIKISSSNECESKMHITGTKELASSEYAVKRLIQYINDTDIAWRPLFLLTLENRYAFICNFVSKIQRPDGSFFLYLSEEMNTIINELSKDNPEFNMVYDFLSRHTLEVKNINQLYDRYIKIISLNIGTHSLFHRQQSINFYDIDINLGSYTINIGKKISLSYLSYVLVNDQELIDDLYSLGYHNINKNRITLMAPVKNYVPKRGYEKSSKIVAYLFHISVTGNIKLFSSAPQEMVYNECYRIFKKILDIINTKEYFEYVNCNSVNIAQNYALEKYGHQFLPTEEIDNNQIINDENFSGSILFEF